MLAPTISHLLRRRNPRSMPDLPQPSHITLDPVSLTCRCRLCSPSITHTDLHKRCTMAVSEPPSPSRQDWQPVLQYDGGGMATASTKLLPFAGSWMLGSPTVMGTSSASKSHEGQEERRQLQPDVAFSCWPSPRTCCSEVSRRRNGRRSRRPAPWCNCWGRESCGHEAFTLNDAVGRVHNPARPPPR